MVEQKVAWASNRPGFGTGSFSCLFYSSSLFLEIFILSSTFEMNAEFEKENEQKKKKNRTEWKKNANSSETITGTQKMLQINTLQCETNTLTTHVTDSCATFISQEELNSVWLVNRFWHTKISIARTINQRTCNIFKHSSNLMRYFSSVSLVEFNPFLLTISICSYPTHVYYSTQISKTISVCAPGMQGVSFILFSFFWYGQKYVQRSKVGKSCGQRG